jgi:hypothetical protein
LGRRYLQKTLFLKMWINTLKNGRVLKRFKKRNIIMRSLWRRCYFPLFFGFTLCLFLFHPFSAVGQNTSGTTQTLIVQSPQKGPTNLRSYLNRVTFDTKKTKEERWSALLDEFPAQNDATDETKKKLVDAFMAEDVDKMPPEYRFAFLDKRIGWYMINGDWQGVLSIRDKLMAPQSVDPKRSLLDVDILQEIAGYFSNIGFPPPGGFEKNKQSGKEMMQYWETHYRNPSEAERIRQYIVDHFDLQYAKTADSLTDLAFDQGGRNKGDLALANWKRFEALDLSKLYRVPYFRSGYEKLDSGKDGLDQDIKNFKKCMPIYVGGMINAASQLQPDQAQKEIKDIAKRYGHYKEVQKEAKEALARVVANAADWKPPVESPAAPTSQVIVADATPVSAETPAAALATPSPTPALATPSPAEFGKAIAPTETANNIKLLFYGSVIVIVGIVGGVAFWRTRKK